MLSDKKIIVLLEDAPAQEFSASVGLSKALPPLLLELAPSVLHLHIIQTHSWLKERDILHIGARSQKNSSYLSILVGKVTAWLPYLLARIFAYLHAGLIAFTIRINMRMALVKVPIWSAIGVDPMSLLRLYFVAKILGTTYEVYLVDDIEAHPNNSKKINIHKFLQPLLQQASNLYAITPELAEELSVRYRVQVNYLPLTTNFKKNTFASGGSPTYFAVYLGSINHLYESGMRLLISQTSIIREITGLNLKIRIIAKKSDVMKIFDFEGGIPEWVESGLVSGENNLGDALADSTFCFLPYSFDEKDRAMTNTSFPSKLIEYLAYGRKIIIYAPKTSIPYRYFIGNKLNFAVKDSSDLHKILLEAIQDKNNYSDEYLKVLRRNHDPKRAASAILEGAKYI